MVHIALTIDTEESEYDSTEAVATALKQELTKIDTELVETIINITPYEGRKYNWEAGKSCPECGCDEFLITIPVIDAYVSIETDNAPHNRTGTLEPVDHIGPNGPKTHVECTNCQTVVHEQLHAPVTEKTPQKQEVEENNRDLSDFL